MEGCVHVFQDFPMEEMMYMDDGMLWNSQLSNLQTRVEQLSVEFASFGLHLNLQKCQLYASPSVSGPRQIRIHGEVVDALDSLEVMGLTLRIGMSVYELASPLASRARSKFWELKHIFRARGGSMKERARVMQKVIGGTALWCIGCIPRKLSGLELLGGLAQPCTRQGSNDGAPCGCGGIGPLQGTGFVPHFGRSHQSAVTSKTFVPSPGGRNRNRLSTGFVIGVVISLASACWSRRWTGLRALLGDFLPTTG